MRVPMPAPHPALCFLGVLLAGIGLDYWVTATCLDGIEPIFRIVPGSTLAAAAVGVAVWGAWTLRRHHTPIEPGHVPATLVTSGPYRFSRNPLYAGQILFLLGLGWAAFPWLLVGAVLQALVLDRLVVPAEEARIATRFGAEFDAYVRAVRRWV